MKTLLKRIATGLLAIVALFLLIQIVPYGRDHKNPPVLHEPAWDSPETRALAVRACFDCHSNETVWPWYSNVAPLSWFIQGDVKEGRQALNFSNWGQDDQQEEGDELGETVEKGAMPPFTYLWLRPEARLTDAEKQQLIQGLSALGNGS